LQQPEIYDLNRLIIEKKTHETPVFDTVLHCTSQAGAKITTNWAP